MAPQDTETIQEAYGTLSPTSHERPHFDSTSALIEAPFCTSACQGAKHLWRWCRHLALWAPCTARCGHTAAGVQEDVGCLKDILKKPAGCLNGVFGLEFRSGWSSEGFEKGWIKLVQDEAAASEKGLQLLEMAVQVANSEQKLTAFITDIDSRPGSSHDKE